MKDREDPYVAYGKVKFVFEHFRNESSKNESYSARVKSVNHFLSSIKSQYLDPTDSEDDPKYYYLSYFDSIRCEESLNKNGLNFHRVQQENSIEH